MGAEHFSKRRSRIWTLSRRALCASSFRPGFSAVARPLTQVRPQVLTCSACPCFNLFWPPGAFPSPAPHIGCPDSIIWITSKASSLRFILQAWLLRCCASFDAGVSSGCALYCLPVYQLFFGPPGALPSSAPDIGCHNSTIWALSKRAFCASIYRTGSSAVADPLSAKASFLELYKKLLNAL